MKIDRNLRGKLTVLVTALVTGIGTLLTIAYVPRVVRAAPPAIGIAEARGAFRVDNATVRGNATVFEGALVETAAQTSHGPAPGAAAWVSLDLLTGARVKLAANSKGRLFSDHMVLEKGAGELEKAQGFKFEARGLTIQPETGIALARIALAGTKVDLEAIAGSFRVLNSQGTLIAAITAGRTLEFEPQAPNAPSRLTGCLVYKAGHYLLTDETTNVVVEVAGPGLDKEKGNRVEIAGGMDPTAAPVSDASQFVRVTSVKRLGKGCAATAPAGAGGPGGRGSGGAGSGAGGLSTTTIAIIGGVAAAGVVGGLAGTGAFSGSSPAVSR